MQLLTLLME